MRISAGMGKFGDQVSVISMTHLPRYTPPFMALSGGGQLCLLFVVCLLFDGSTARKMPYTPQDRADLNRRPDGHGETILRFNQAHLRAALHHT